MITVYFRFKDETPKELVTNIESLFYICWIFEHNDDIINFKVCMGGNIVFPAHFGWANFNKWVEKLYNNKEEN